MDWLLYSDRTRFTEIPTEHMFVLQGTMFVASDGREIQHTSDIYGKNWHVFLETTDFELAWASVPKPGIVVTESEMRTDPVLVGHLEAWRSGDDSAYRRFLNDIRAGTDD
jgi:hypothetical protein